MGCVFFIIVTEICKKCLLFLRKAAQYMKINNPIRDVHQFRHPKWQSREP